MTVKISFSGTHNCGKTTVASYLKRHGTASVAVIPELARLCPYDWSTYQGAVWMLTTQMQWELQLSKHEIILMDRCVLDMVAYAKAQGFCNGLLTRLATLWLDYYPIDMLFHVKPKSVMVDDGVRDTDVVFQRRVEDEWEHVFEVYANPQRVHYVACVELNDLSLILDCVERVIANSRRDS